MNNIVLIGRMTKDPELKYTSTGKGNTRFTLAVSRNKDEADFINCVAWEKTGETIAEYFRKGNRILIQGRLSVSNYEQNGEKRKSTKVVVNSFEFVESSGTSNNNGGYQQNQPYNGNGGNSGSKPVHNNTYENDDDTDDNEDFPF